MSKLKNNKGNEKLMLFMSTHLYIARTINKGRGVFTSKDIKKGTVIEICPTIVFGVNDRKLVNDTFLYEYYFEWGITGRKGAVALGFGSLYNHSYTPNARYYPDFDLNILEFQSIKNIKAGEEITVNYNYDPDNDKTVWLERDKIKIKKQTP